MSEKDREGGQEPFAPSAVDQPRRGVSRRRVLQTGAAAGVALAWAVPAVEAFASGQAFAAVSPTTPPTNDFVFAVAFSALDPDQKNGEGYFWPLGVVVTGSSDHYKVNYLTNNSRGPSPYTVYDYISGNLFAFHVDVPPANGDLSAYENGSKPHSKCPTGTYSNTSAYKEPTGNPPAALGQIQPGGYEGFGARTLAPPSNYPSSQDSAGFDASFDGSSLMINFYVDVVPEGETGGSNFPDIFIYQATVFQPNSSWPGGVETATVISQVWQGPESAASPPAADEILLYSSSSNYSNVIYLPPGIGSGDSGKENLMTYVFPEF
jgi:hypothetical protein